MKRYTLTIIKLSKIKLTFDFQELLFNGIVEESKLSEKLFQIGFFDLENINKGRNINLNQSICLENILKNSKTEKEKVFFAYITRIE